MSQTQRKVYLLASRYKHNRHIGFTVRLKDHFVTRISLYPNLESTSRLQHPLKCRGIVVNSLWRKQCSRKHCTYLPGLRENKFFVIIRRGERSMECHVPFQIRCGGMISRELCLLQKSPTMDGVARNIFLASIDYLWHTTS